MSREIPSYEKGTILSIAFKQFKTSIDKSFEKYIETCQKNTDNIKQRWKYVFIDDTKYNKKDFDSDFPNGYFSKDKSIYTFENCFSIQKNLSLERILSEFNNVELEEEIKEYFNK